MTQWKQAKILAISPKKTIKMFGVVSHQGCTKENLKQTAKHPLGWLKLKRQISLAILPFLSSAFTPEKWKHMSADILNRNAHYCLIHNSPKSSVVSLRDVDKETMASSESNMTRPKREGGCWSEQEHAGIPTETCQMGRTVRHRCVSLNHRKMSKATVGGRKSRASWLLVGTLAMRELSRVQKDQCTCL